MILKKPYAFLIKYYRIIHLGLFAFLGYFTYKYTSIINFFNEYVRNGYKTTIVSNLEKIYTPASVFIVIIMIILFSMLILVLLNHKKKPYGLYLMMLFYYTIALAGAIYLSVIFKSFEYELLSSTLSRSIRDILIIVYLPQFIFWGFIILRVIGFDVKKFDFSDSKKELGTNELDEEEVEVSFSFDGYKIRKRIKKYFREIIYYLKENKFIVLCILIAIFVYFGVYIYQNTHGNYDKTYYMGKEFIYNNLNIVVEDAILTNVDYNGNIIDDKYYYYVLKINVSNNSGNTINLDLNNFKLKLGDKNNSPSINISSLFKDFASGVIGSTFAPKANKSFALAYQIPKKESSRNAVLNIYNGSVYEKGDYLTKKINVNVKAAKYVDKTIEGNYFVGNKIDLSESILKESSLQINNYSVSKKYSYNYMKCDKNNNCKEYTNILTSPLHDNRHDNRLLVLKSELIMDETSAFFQEYDSLYSFAESFVDIQYKIDDEVFINGAINVTPKESTGLMVFELPKNIEKANVIQVIVTVRNKQYYINLKVE